jgi:hypothetical protein
MNALQDIIAKARFVKNVIKNVKIVLILNNNAPHVIIHLFYLKIK